MSRYTLSSLVRDEGDWAIACNSYGNLVSINEMGKIILQLLSEESLTLSQIFKKLNEKVDVTEFRTEDVENAVLNFLDDMMREKIISNDRNGIENESRNKALYLRRDNLGTKEMFVNSPLNAIILLTNKCNQKCKFCYIDPSIAYYN